MPNQDLYGVRELTLHEYQITRLLTAGMKDKEIATALGIKEGTVKNHLRRIYDKTGMGNRVELALWYIYHHEQIIKFDKKE